MRLYVFDCGVLVRGEPTVYNLTREQVGDTNFADPCYLVAHPRGTLLWDVGIIPDAQIKPGGVEVTVANGINKAHKTLISQLAEARLQACRHYLPRLLAQPCRSRRECERLRGIDVARSKGRAGQ